jgi:RNA polymerase sigma factor (sigma-70 family)
LEAHKKRANAPDIEWSGIVFSELFFSRVSRIAHRTIADPATAEQAVTFAIQRLSENDWARCKKYTGKSSPETFVYSLSSNAIIDYSRQCYGRQRPPSWLQKKGSTWVAIWKAMCLERLPEQVVVDQQCRRGNTLADTVRHIVVAIKAKEPWCGHASRTESLDEGEHLSHLAHTGVDSDQSAQHDAEAALQFAAVLLAQSGDDATSHQPFDAQAVQSVQQIDVEATEYLILKLLYCEGMSGAAVARTLGLSKKDFDRLKKQVLEKARRQLLASGIGGSGA